MDEQRNEMPIPIGYVKRFSSWIRRFREDARFNPAYELIRPPDTRRVPVRLWTVAFRNRACKAVHRGKLVRGPSSSFSLLPDACSCFLRPWSYVWFRLAANCHPSIQRHPSFPPLPPIFLCISETLRGFPPQVSPHPTRSDACFPLWVHFRRSRLTKIHRRAQCLFEHPHDLFEIFRIAGHGCILQYDRSGRDTAET